MQSRSRADVEPSIELQNVTFGYKPGQTVLHNVSLRVEPRQVVALVGPTGSGKTSITALAHRFYDVRAGNVLIGGHDVRDVTLDFHRPNHRHGAAGAVPVFRHDLREYPLCHQRWHATR